MDDATAGYPIWIYIFICVFLYMVQLGYGYKVVGIIATIMYYIQYGRTWLSGRQ